MIYGEQERLNGNCIYAVTIEMANINYLKIKFVFFESCLSTAYIYVLAATL